jgi:hypothetical protein
MLIIVDQRIPEEARENLASYGQVLGLQTGGIVYDAISGHPDIFMCLVPGGVVVADGLPISISSVIAGLAGVHVIHGNRAPGNKYPLSAAYNAVVDGSRAIYNPRVTDTAIQQCCRQLDIIPVKQGYTRCNLAALGGDVFITSDQGIQRSLIRRGLKSFYTDPQGIVLPGLANGFFGGACGVSDKKLFINGSLRRYNAHRVVEEAAKAAGLDIVELCDGPLYDGGGIFFFPQ